MTVCKGKAWWQVRAHTGLHVQGQRPHTGGRKEEGMGMGAVVGDRQEEAGIRLENGAGIQVGGSWGKVCGERAKVPSTHPPSCPLGRVVQRWHTGGKGWVATPGVHVTCPGKTARKSLAGEGRGPCR